MPIDLSGRRKKKTPDTEMQAVSGANPFDNGALMQEHNTTPGGVMSKEFLQAELAKLPMEKQVGYCLWKIGLLTQRDKELTVEDYRPDLTMWQAIDKAAQIQFLSDIKAEMFALLLYEQRTGRAQYALTMRDKLLLYIEAVQAMSDYDAEILDRPCTWTDFKKAVAKQVAAGKEQLHGDE